MSIVDRNKWWQTMKAAVIDFSETVRTNELSGTSNDIPKACCADDVIDSAFGVVLLSNNVHGKWLIEWGQPSNGRAQAAHWPAVCKMSSAIGDSPKHNTTQTILNE